MDQLVAVLDAMSATRADRLRAFLPPGFTLTHATEPGEAAMKAVIRDADFAISGQVAVTRDVLAAARKLKLLHKWGVGVDNFTGHGLEQLRYGDGLLPQPDDPLPVLRAANYRAGQGAAYFVSARAG